MIQTQKWWNFTRILVTPSDFDASVQVDIPRKGYHLKESKADALIYALWVGEDDRRDGLGKAMLYIAEDQAREAGAKSVCLTWDDREAPKWTRDWYLREGYRIEKMRGHKYTLIKDLTTEE